MDQAKAAAASRSALTAANLAIVNSAPGQAPRWAITAKPYLQAIADNNYGLEDPEMCVLYALNNLTTWRGETARAVKRMLNEAIK